MATIQDAELWLMERYRSAVQLLLIPQLRFPQPICSPDLRNGMRNTAEKPRKYKAFI